MASLLPLSRGDASARPADPPARVRGTLERVREAAPELATTVSVGATLAWWSTYFLWGTGGREPRVLSVAVALLGVSLLLVRPWRSLPLAALLLGNGVGVGAWVVVLTAPTGFAGAHEAASYTYAAQLGLVVLAWATTAPRRSALLVVLMAAAGLQFTQGWLAWWGRQDPSAPFQGTFYWHNQAGIFLAAGALVAYTVVVAAQRPLSPLAWVVGPLCAAGTVFTTSRGSQIGLALGILLLMGLPLRARGLRGGFLRLAGVVVVSWGTATALAGPPFFSERVAVTASTAARSESLLVNGVQRFEDWRRAFAIFAEWPVSGAGFYSFDSATTMVTEKRDGFTTAFAHNGFLQAAADGGLVLAVPLVLALGAVLAVGARSVPASLRAGDLLQPGAAVTFLVLLLHSGMDFDWTYPGLLSLTALVSVLALPAELGGTPPRRPGLGALAAVAADRRVQVALGVLAVGLLVVSGVTAWDGGLRLNFPVTG